MPVYSFRHGMSARPRTPVFTMAWVAFMVYAVAVLRHVM